MARMPRARAIPKAVAQLITSAEVGSSFLVSMLIRASAAVVLALLISAAVSGLEAWTNQPDTVGFRPRRWTACSVMTVLGAETPDGRALTSWITGLATQSVGGQGNVWAVAAAPGGLAAEPAWWLGPWAPPHRRRAPAHCHKGAAYCPVP